ncbi:MAG: hypothetical protein WA154_13025 [Moraxellaceae bacterium]
MSRDKLNNANRLRVARLVVGIFDRIQQHPIKEEQLLAMAGAFVLMADALDIPAQDAFVAVKNLMTNPHEEDGLVHQFAAMGYHLKTELLQDG